jgi:hypothetical protein
MEGLEEDFFFLDFCSNNVRIMVKEAWPYLQGHSALYAGKMRFKVAWWLSKERKMRYRVGT